MINVAVLGATGNVGQRFVEQLADHPLGKIVSLHQPRGRQLSQARRQPPMSADDAMDQLLVRQVVQSS